MIHAEALKPPVAPLERPYIEAVYATTLTEGWPHPPELSEMWGVLARVVRASRPGPAGIVNCAFRGETIRTVRCGVVGRDGRYRVDVTVWPGGEYRLRGLR